MQQIKIRKGISFQQIGEPQQIIDSTDAHIRSARHIALCGEDFRHLQPDLLVAIGDQVSAGQPLFSVRNQPDVLFTAPASGTVQKISTGRRRTLDLLVIERNGNDHVMFEALGQSTDRESLKKLLLKSGLWISFRTRPFNRIPKPDSLPSNIFVTAMDTSPLAADPRVVLQIDQDLFRSGLQLIATLTDGNTYICQSPGAPLADLSDSNIIDVAFAGQHPAGTAGTHIHALSAVSRHKFVWSIDYQDVVAIGELVQHGSLRTTRIVSLAGSGVEQPRLVRAFNGANLEELISTEDSTDNPILISGSALSGRRDDWLGRYHNQVTVMQRESSPQTSISKLTYWLTQHLPGNSAIVPDNWLDDISPLNSLMVPLLRALAVGDIDTAEELGCLSFATEDIAPLSHVCSTGLDYAVLLNNCLDEISSSVDMKRWTAYG